MTDYMAVMVDKYRGQFAMRFYHEPKPPAHYEFELNVDGWLFRGSGPVELMDAAVKFEVPIRAKSEPHRWALMEVVKDRSQWRVLKNGGGFQLTKTKRDAERLAAEELASMADFNRRWLAEWGATISDTEGYGTRWVWEWDDRFLKVEGGESRWAGGLLGPTWGRS